MDKNINGVCSFCKENVNEKLKNYSSYICEKCIDV